MKTNIHVYPSNFDYEKRIIQEVNYITQNNLVDKVYILAKSDYGKKQKLVFSINNKVVVIRIKSFFNIKWIDFIFYNILSIMFLLKIKPNYINYHSITVINLSIIGKLFKSVNIYDAHELETERVNVHGMKKLIFKLIERFFIMFIDKILVVNESIMNEYKKKYPNKTLTFVLNTFDKNINNSTTNNLSLRDEFNIPNNKTIYIYQGLINQGRGIEIILETFKKMPSKYIVFMGFGPLQKKVMEFSRHYENIIFKKAVKQDQILSITRSADIGISLIENTCKSYYLSLPNKIFEYLSSDIPIIVSDFPEMSAVINKYNCGWKVIPSVEKLKFLLNSINKKDIKLKSKNITKAIDAYSWENESLKLDMLYK